MLQTWSEAELLALYDGCLSPIVYDSRRGVPFLRESVLTTKDDDKVRYIEQRRVDDYVRKDLRASVETPFGRSNNTNTTRSSLEGFVKGRLFAYAKQEYIQYGNVERGGVIVNLDPRAKVSATTDPTVVNIEVSFYVNYQIRTINININLIN